LKTIFFFIKCPGHCAEAHSTVFENYFFFIKCPGHGVEAQSTSFLRKEKREKRKEKREKRKEKNKNLRPCGIGPFRKNKVFEKRIFFSNELFSLNSSV
jgi:hypothetical protein